jgi:hypothetical protein
LFVLLFTYSCADKHQPASDLGDGPQPFNWPDFGDMLEPDSKPAENDRCVGSKAVTFTAGKATISATTKGRINEYGDKIRCGESVSFLGPQRYYKISFKTGTTYQFELTPQFEASMYLFSQCNKTLINVDCGSNGATGDLVTKVSAKSTGVMAFKASAAGNYILAVDSIKTDASGSFKLVIKERKTVSYSLCSKAQALTFESGKVTVKDNTLGADNEFATDIHCGMGVDFDGSQLYYSLTLEKGTWYRFDLTPDFLASLYVFNKAGQCLASSIDTDCGGITGTVLPFVTANSTGSTTFSPLTSGSYILAVDSLDPKQAGAFTLIVQKYTPPSNMVCNAAKPLVFSEQVASTTGSTKSFINDLGAHVSCGKVLPLVGPQAYYSITLKKEKYELFFKPTFPAVLAIGSSCLTLPVDCGSSGLSGDLLKTNAGAIGTKVFDSPKAGTYVLAVDGTSAAASGTFELQVKPYSTPTNGKCSSPSILSLGTSPVVVLGDTGPLKNDLADIKCDATTGPWNGPQAYYRGPLIQGKSYKVELTPEASFDPALYAFSASADCTSSSIDTGCTGLSSDNVGAGVKEMITIVPNTSEDYYIVVDSWSPSEVGKYSLRLSW